MSQLSKAFHYLSRELATERYATYTIGDLVDKSESQLAADKVHVALRIDVDSDLHLCPLLADEFSKKGFSATFYFLVHPERYYDIWNSNVPATVATKEFEVGLHTDHYFEELKFRNGDPGEVLRRLRVDINRLSELTGRPVLGITAHGHQEMDETDNKNWNPYANLSPAELNLRYHDRTLDKLEERPDVVRIQDHLQVTNGWSYWPKYPQTALRRVPLGSIVLLYAHPDTFYRLPAPAPVGAARILKKIYFFARIRLRHQFVGALIGEGKSARKELKRFLKVRPRIWEPKR